MYISHRVHREFKFPLSYIIIRLAPAIPFSWSIAYGEQPPPHHHLQRY